MILLVVRNIYHTFGQDGNPELEK